MISSGAGVISVPARSYLHSTQPKSRRMLDIQLPTSWTADTVVQWLLWNREVSSSRPARQVFARGKQPYILGHFSARQRVNLLFEASVSLSSELEQASFLCSVPSIWAPTASWSRTAIQP